MSPADRPDPDALLENLKKAEAKAKQARLKIFLGMSAGVGKTYAMLRAAQKLRQDGHNVVAGIVETHGRAETQSLVEAVPQLARKRLEYKGTLLEDMDLDAILKLKPEYVLVDELAHSNAPGCRHAKRYQDVLELLDNGIHVYTTLNVQHVESRSDVVHRITRIPVRETVPDSILEIAEVELVDTPPDVLLKRLAEGKVYLGDRAERAAQNFFRLGNLTALREIALRLTAERVDRDLQRYMQENRIEGPWKSTERLLVAVGASPTSGQLIRWTCRIAANLEAPWIAVYVETSRDISAEDQKTLNSNLALAKELGAQIVTTSDVDIVRALLRVARQQNVSQIVVGKPVEGYFKRFFGDPSPVQRLIRQSGDIDVYVVEGGKGKRLQIVPMLKSQFSSDPRQYLTGVGLVLAATLLSYFFIEPIAGYWSVGLIMLTALIFQALFTGKGPILVSALLTATLWNYLFIPPRFTFHVEKTEDVLLLLIYLVVAAVTGTLASRIRSRERAFHARERRATALLEFGRELGKAASLNEVVEHAVRLIGSTFDAEVAMSLRAADEGLQQETHPASSWKMDEKELSVALWSYTHRQAAGRFTRTLSESSGLHMPLMVATHTVGVLSLKRRNDRSLSIEEKSLADALINQLALSLERELLLEQTARIRAIENSERLHKLLLSSVSHELRTPIATIKASASALMDDGAGRHPETNRTFISEISQANERLDRLVTNLLDMSRLESGHLKPHHEWCDLGDIVRASVESLNEKASGHRVSVELPAELPLIYGDFVLLEQALKNIVHNAVFHTPSGTAIQIQAGVDADRVFVRVVDKGPGISEEALRHIFDKFYRAPQARAGGTGLGLSIARGFIEAHGGKLEAANRPCGGASFTLWLPKKAVPEIPAEPPS